MTTTTLYNRQAGSDKVYQVTIDPITATTSIVTFAYGRRGSTLTTGTKTPEPVRHEVAGDIAAKLIRSKQAGGYVIASALDKHGGPLGLPSAAVAAPVSTAPAADPTLPMLLKSITEAELDRLLRDGRYCAQQKHDGKRMTLTLRSVGGRGVVTAVNKRGLPCGFPATVQRAMLDLLHLCVIDGEMVGDTFMAFDLLSQDNVDVRHRSYAERHDMLRRLLYVNDEYFIHLQCVDSETTLASKQDLLDQLRADNAEGIVFKDLHAPWQSSRPSTGGPALKFKFTETASFIVGSTSTGKRSVELILYENQGRVRGFGNVTIPPNHSIPPADSIVEVRYLYAYPGGCVFQPVYLGPRDDVTPQECHISQLKLKAA
jgi:bifunctional non-homologous end joining protein LigD